MFTILTIIFLLFSVCDGKSRGKSVCDTIIDYKKNVLPTSIKRMGKSDYVGAVAIIAHYAYVSNYKKYWPYQTDDDCKTQHFTVAKLTVQFSMRPRGCCTTCCLIHNTEAHLKLYYVEKNKKTTLVNLNTKNKGTLAALGISSSATTVIYFHGFTEDGSSGISGKILAQAYLSRNETYNVFKLDYSQLAAVPWYLEAIENCKLIAKAIAKFLIFYDKTGELPIENMHLIGISLGAQLASHVAKAIGKRKKVKRLTGLDPAYALYPENDDSENIAKTDAEFVDIIHTDPGGNGFPTSLGHADFYIDYPPGPHSQCNIFDLIEKGLIGYFPLCDHIRSFVMYIDSVDNPYAYPVKTTVNGTTLGYMGLLANKTTTLGDIHMINQHVKNAYERALEEDD